MNKLFLLLAGAVLVFWGTGINNAGAATPVAPSITTQPVNNVTVTAPAKATFSLTATGTPSPTYQWMQEAVGASTFTAISGATKATYTTAATSAANNGTQFECVVSNAAGSVTSNVVTLTVNVVPSITTQPTDLTEISPATATFTVAASGLPAPSYQWMQKVSGGTYTNISGATSASYTTPATTATDSWTKFECVVSNAVGSVTSKEATLIVYVTPNIAVQPVTVTVTAPAKATFTVTATGTPNPTYQWMESVNGGTFTDISGETKASYKTAATTLADSGTQFECVISNAAGSVTSSAATLTVDVTPSITTQPTDVIVTAPATATFTVVASGTPAPTYQWMEKVKGGTYTNIQGATSSSYTTLATSAVDNKARFECVISNAAGSVTSGAVKLTVDEVPSITVEPDNVTVTAPATATFTVTASGTPKPTYQWMESVNGGAFTNISGATKHTYKTAATTIADNGTQFECVVTNIAGNVTSVPATLTVNSVQIAPSITTQPVNVTVTAPATATFTVVATGTLAPTYQWMQEVQGASTFTSIIGATSASYTTPATTVTDNGTQFECVVSNTAGSVTSNAATLTVNVGPNITTQPVNATVTAPATATFAVVATGTPAPSYQWMQSISGGAFTNITGATSFSYTTPATTATNNGVQYECVITNTVGSVTSNAASLTVNVVANITTQPTSLTVTAPLAATFTVAAIGTPAPAYQWMQSINGGAFANISGATNASYIIPATTTANSGDQFECVVTNIAGSVTSTAVTLTVNPTPVAPTITTQPLSQAVTVPASVTFTAAASGTPTPTYQWEVSIDGGTTFTPISRAISATYTITSTTTSFSGNEYEVVATNGISPAATSTAAILTVNPAPVAPSITTQPINATVTAPATATFTVVATGTPAPTYQWMQNVNGGTFTNVTTGTGATSASYTTPATTTTNSGTQYECVVTNSAGNATSTAVTLTVNPTPAAPTITTQPGNVTVTAPATATFTVAANGTPAPSYQWMQETQGAGTFIAIPGATSTSYTTPPTTTANSGTQYECAVTNSVGSLTSTAATVTVNPPPPAAPTITTQPVNVTVVAPAPATFTVVATGNPSPTYQWQQGLATRFGTIFANITGATSASYTTAATTTSNSGTKYSCVVSNASGNVTSNAVTLTVSSTAAPPTITTQPVNATVTSPQTATFTVAATGAPSPTYQWQQEAPGAGTYSAITGATGASYITPATIGVNNGTLYECVVSNTAGSVTSNPASLTVNVSTLPLVAITSPANNSNFTTGSNLTITASASETNGTISSVTFYNGTTQLGTSTTSPYSYTLTNLSAGNYNLTAVATDANGNSTTSSPVIVSVTANPIPVVAITSPANNTSISEGTSLTFTANASETNGTINAVYYYNGTTQIGTGFYPPYSWTYILPAGIDNITAVAKDANGVSTTSSPVSITVIPPATTIISPVNQSTLTTRSININAMTTEGGEAYISYVSFYNGTTLLGTAYSNSNVYSYQWSDIPAGTYNLTVVTTYVSGGQVTSSPVTVTINSPSSPFTYAVDNNIFSKTDPLGHTTSYQYDNDNRLLKTTFADNSTVSEAYDLFGNQTSVTDQRGNALTKSYDAYERLAQTKDPLNGITQFNYDTEGHLLTLTDANGHATTYTYDPNGKVLTQSNALNFTTTFTYDPDSNVASRADANGKTTNYIYDALNRLTNTAYPDGTSVANIYDVLSRKTSMTDTTGQTTYTYDALSRLLTKTAPGTNSTITYTYDSEGNRLTSVDQNNRTITNTYDTLNRLASVQDPNGTTSYSYDADSKKTEVASPNGVTESYTYDILNKVLTAVNQGGSGVISSFSNVYDIAGMITKKTLQDGSWTAYSYDALNRLLEETKQTSSGIVYDYVYTYDPVGNRLTWTKNTTLGNFWSVDSLNMPAQVLTNLTNANYGNTANPTQAMNLVRDYTYDTANRLSNWSYGINIYSQSFPVQTDTYTYDNNGNRLTKQVALTGQTTPEQTNYAYDFENRLNQLTYANIPSITGTQTDSLIYNGEGLRTQAVLNSVAANYLYDGSNILVERDGTGNTTKTYTRGLDFGGGIGSIINQNYTANNTAVTQYYDYNDLGSTSDLTTSTGSSASSYSFDAFGNLLTPQSSSDTNRYLFSTKEFDLRSGLYFFGKRYFDPEVGRWITPDPLGFVNGPNLYLYVLDNPINMVDPDGLCLQDLERVIGGVGDSISDFLQSPDGLALTAYLGVGASLETSAVNVTEATATANSAIENNFQRFVNNLPAQAETPTTIEFGDGSVAFQAKVPATNIPGSYAVYEKQVDAYGNTTQFTITTYAPDGSIVYVKNKLTGEVLK